MNRYPIEMPYSFVFKIINLVQITSYYCMAPCLIKKDISGNQVVNTDYSDRNK